MVSSEVGAAGNTFSPRYAQMQVTLRVQIHGRSTRFR